MLFCCFSSKILSSSLLILIFAKLAGFLAVIFGSPFDVVKTRMMSSTKGSGEYYKNPLDCAIKTLKKEVWI